MQSMAELFFSVLYVQAMAELFFGVLYVQLLGLSEYQAMN